MGVYAGPDIVEDGLVLHLDAANRRSYPTTGNTWSSLSSISFGTTSSQLINGATFNSSNSGVIKFDGINDYCSFFAPNLGTAATIEMWCKLNSGWSGGNGKMFFGWQSYDVWTGTSTYAGSIGFNTANSDLYGITLGVVNSLNLPGNWAHYIFEMRSDVSYTNNKIYINGNQMTLSQINSSGAIRSFNNGNGRIAIWINDLNYCMPMDCAIFKIYNKILSLKEIQKNFNVLRGRFGI